MQTHQAYRLPTYLLWLLLQILSLTAEAGEWRQVAHPLEPRRGATATLLSDGSVLVVGGQSTTTGAVLSTAEIYHPSLDKWTATGLLTKARILHSATLLGSGRVLVVGGNEELYSSDLSLDAAEIYDPATNQWSPAKRLRTARFGHTATALADGRILVAGGANFGGSRFVYDLMEAEIFDEQGATWTSGGLIKPRVEHTATRLNTGEVAIVGGYSGRSLASVEIFHPASATWRSASPLLTSRSRHAAVLTSDGKIVVTGGVVDAVYGLETTERYDPNSDRWSSVGPMLRKRDSHTLVTLTSRNLLTIGGGSMFDTPVALPDVEIFDILTGSWSPRPPLTSINGNISAVLLNDGRVLAINAGRAEIYTEDRPPPLGTVDETFGVLGRSSASLPGGSAYVIAAERDLHDNSTVIVSKCLLQLRSYCVVRLDASGHPSTTFGSDGTAVGSSVFPTGVSLQRDGKILLAGNCATTALCVVRLSVDGSVDQSFGNGGTLTVDAERSWTNGRVAALADGRFVVGGGCKSADGTWSFCTARYRSDATRDTTYATGAVSILPAGLPGLTVLSLTTQRDGSVVVGAVCGRKHAFAAYVVLDYTGCAAKFTSTGAVDTAFGIGALAVAAFPDGYSTVITLDYSECCGPTPADTAVLEDGRVIVANRCMEDARNKPAVCVARWNANGAPDTTFGANGRLAVPIAPGCVNNVFSRMTALAGGHVVLLLRCVNETGRYENEPRTMRLLPGGQVDEAFSNSMGWAFSPAVMFPLPSQDVVAVGNWFDASRTAPVAYRLLGQSSTAMRTMVEYRYMPLDYYFITARSNEQLTLDSTAGWSRTGESFNLYGSGTGVTTLTRFFFAQIARGATRGSHFYTLIPNEVSAVQALNPANLRAPGKPVNEGGDGYALSPGTDGTCPPASTPVYRLFRGNARFPDDPNHRFTARRPLYDQLIVSGWDGEGIKLCAAPRQ